jgi:hypothetical protein
MFFGVGVRIVLERVGLNFEIKLKPVRLGHKWVALVTSCVEYFPTICNILRACQVEGLSHDSSDAFENTSQESETIFVVYEALKTSVIIFLLSRWEKIEMWYFLNQKCHLNFLILNKQSK